MNSFTKPPRDLKPGPLRIEFNCYNPFHDKKIKPYMILKNCLGNNIYLYEVNGIRYSCTKYLYFYILTNLNTKKKTLALSSLYNIILPHYFKDIIDGNSNNS